MKDSSIFRARREQRPVFVDRLFDLFFGSKHIALACDRLRAQAPEVAGQEAFDRFGARFGVTRAKELGEARMRELRSPAAIGHDDRKPARNRLCHAEPERLEWASM